MKRDFVKNVVAIVVTFMTLSTLNPVGVYAEWKKDEKNKWSWTENGTKYIGWKIINGKWYHFNDNGIMSVGWIKDKEKWYNLSDSGTINTGWVKDVNGKWYNLSSSGAMNIGWIKDIDGKWYNLSEDGSMNTGWISENNKWYYMNSSGAMETGNINIDGKFYRFLDNGVLSDSTISSSGEANYGKESNSKEKNDVQENVKGSTELRKAYVATESSPLNIRSGASTSSKIIGTLSKGTEVMAETNQVDGFLHISSNGFDGWASSAWISFEKPNISARDQDKDSSKNNDKIDSSLSSIRTSAPEVNNPCYYSDSNVFYKVKLSPPYSKGGNCTWYSWGRAWEITGEPPTEAGFIGNAYEWWEANKKSGKYKYGSTPKVGAIAVWKSSMPGSGGFGHVAVVEKIENNKIYISESMWHGGIFKYAEIYSTEYLYGYIYLNEPNY